MRKSRIKALVTLSGLLCLVALASPVPNSIIVTANNAGEYGVQVVEIPSGDSGHRAFEIQFPTEIEPGCMLGRVQTATFNAEGEQLSISSFDTSVYGQRATAILGYKTADQDMKVGLHYCCNQLDSGCEIMLSIESLEEFSHNNAFNSDAGKAGAG